MSDSAEAERDNDETADDCQPEAADGNTEDPVVTGVEPPAGNTILDDAVNFEVVVLSLSALHEIAAEIAARVKLRVASDRCILLVGDETLPASIAEWRAFSVRMNAIERAMEETPELRADFSGGLERREAPLLSGASDAVESIVRLLSFFKADTTYFGRAVHLDENCVRSAIGGRLVEVGAGRVILAGTPMLDQPGHGQDLFSRIERVLCGKLRLEALLAESHEGHGPEDEQSSATGGNGTAYGSLEPAGSSKRSDVGSASKLRKAASLIGAVNGLLNELIGLEEGRSRLTALLAASRIASLIEDAEEAYLLSSQVIRGGGHYRVRKHLFTTLFTGDQVSYSGGAALSFVLLDLKTMSLADSDVLYFAVGNSRFTGRLKYLRPSNLGKHLRRGGQRA